MEGSGYTCTQGFHGAGSSSHGDRVSGQGWPRIKGPEGNTDLRSVFSAGLGSRGLRTSSGSGQWSGLAWDQVGLGVVMALKDLHVNALSLLRGSRDAIGPY